MAFLEDVVDWIASEVTQIGLSSNGTTEITGGGYVHLAPTYGAAVAGVADITATLAFDGTVGTNITHLIYKRTPVATPENWVIRPVALAAAFNSDGRLDVTSAEVSAAFLV